MNAIVVEALGKEFTIEYDRDSMIKMEEMGYNAMDPTSKMYTSFEIMVYGGVLKHQPKTTWAQAVDICKELIEQYGMGPIMEALAPMIQEVFFPGGIDKKPKKKIKKA